MANPTVIGNPLNAFAAPVQGFPFPNGAAIIELQNGEASTTLQPGTLVNLVTTGTTKTGPVQVVRAQTTGQSDLNIGVVVGQAVPVNGLATVLVAGVCIVNNGAAGGITAGHVLGADTSTRGCVIDLGASGAITAANIGNCVGVAISSANASTPCLAYICKF